MEPSERPSERVEAKGGWVALGYFAVYMAYLFWRPENEAMHWVTLVAAPFAIAWVSLRRGRSAGGRPAGFRATLASLGLRRGNLTRGLGWALLVGAAITVFQAFGSGRAAEIQALFRSGRALWLLPLTFTLMLFLAGFTEEVFFRGFIQTRVEALTGSRWGAVIVVALLFGFYHLPYAYLNPAWPSHGDWGAAWVAAMGQGVPGGLILGALYVVSRGNLLACVVLHSLINAAPAMTMIHFGGG